MILTLDVPKEVEDGLTAEAVRQGVPIEEYALRLLSMATRNRTPKTGAELVEYWRKENLIGTRTDIVDSQQHARTLRQSMERRNHD
jgi:hypothetical protein